jgi:hypothetical protein
MHDDVAPGVGFADIAPRRKPDHLQTWNFRRAGGARDRLKVRRKTRRKTRRLRRGPMQRHQGAERGRRQTEFHGWQYAVDDPGIKTEMRPLQVRRAGAE